MHSPIVYTVQEGKEIVKMYLSCAAAVFFNEDFRYIRTIHDEHFAVLEFETQLNTVFVNGIDMITWNDRENITDFKVMIRPLKVI